jgi:uncharacterized protein (DUF2236 family)
MLSAGVLLRAADVASGTVPVVGSPLPGSPRQLVVLPGPFAVLQAQAQRRVRRLLAGDRLPIDPAADPGDPGLLGPGSVSWAVIGDPAALIGGIRGLLLQSCHPLVLQGVVDHSSYQRDPIGRLQRTVSYVVRTTFGSEREARDAAAGVLRAHRFVSGELDGVRYSANDPRLLAWVHCTLVDSFLVAYQRFGPAPLSAADQDRFVAEQAVLASLLGTDPVPASVFELGSVLDGFTSELGRSPATGETVRFLLRPPLPLPALPVYRSLLAAGTSTLDVGACEVLGLPPPAGSSPAELGARATLWAWRMLMSDEVAAAAYARAAARPAG